MKIAFFLGLLSLAGCGHPQYVDDDYSSGGAASNASSGALLGFAAQMLSPRQPAMAMPVQTTCQRMGIYTNCTSY